jgi:acylphosphatase
LGHDDGNPRQSITICTAMLSIYVEGWQAQPRDGTVNVDAAGKTGKMNQAQRALFNKPRPIQQ